MQLAAGDSLEDLLAGKDLRPRGHALEVRVYAESPADGYLPAAGTLERVIEPSGPGVRVDSGVVGGMEVSVHFDPMLAKIITYGQDRETACQRMAQALRETAYLGIPTNLDFLARIIDSEAFRNAELRTDFLDQHPEMAAAAEGTPSDVAFIAAALSDDLVGAGGGVGAAGSGAAGSGADKQAEVWDTLGPVRLWGNE